MDLEQTYPALADAVRPAREALTRFAAKAGASREQIQAVRLAASETLTNVVRHAYPNGSGSFHITAAADPRHEDHDDMLDWLGLESAEQFDPNACDLVEINEALNVTVAARR